MIELSLVSFTQALPVSLSPRPHDSVLMDGWHGVGSFLSLTLFLHQISHSSETDGLTETLGKERDLLHV